MHFIVSLDAFGESSSADSLFALVDFLLGDVSVSVIGPHRGGSQLGSLAISPSFIGDISDGSSLVVVGH